MARTGAGLPTPTCRGAGRMGDTVAMHSRVLCDRYASANLLAAVDDAAGRGPDRCVGGVADADIARRVNSTLADTAGTTRRLPRRRPSCSRCTGRRNLHRAWRQGAVDGGQGFHAVSGALLPQPADRCALESYRGPEQYSFSRRWLGRLRIFRLDLCRTLRFKTYQTRSRSRFFRRAAGVEPKRRRKVVVIRL